ncbi:ABC transporter substrate-binding protein [Nocardiopsis sp. N85]|uniref:ABC transporter substrate-binding protein n=1 Tax=Nocardiopsis sp. N85 TaxID=3029400 RepID=UPI00237F5952|nr:ABC transporter substrate-binding protein [Nocardiopsis sp. N85]MDE3724861.1 ABC transporter substrate-binding protein [Nocardiopsis sp. N85]
MITPTTSLSRYLGAAALATAVLATAACGGSEASTEEDPTTAMAIDEERCETNRAAGTVTYITGYYFQASVSQLEVFAAEELGFFDAVCLDVEVQAGVGDIMANSQLVSAGTAHFTPLANEGEVVQANENDHEIVGLATYGHVPIASLLTKPDIEDLKDLEGKTLGRPGMLGAPLEAMLLAADVDLDAVEQVETGYDPSILPRDQVQALAAYRSNEPNQLDAMGEEYTEWLPEDFGVVGSFGVMGANSEWAAENPTVVEDFLRAIGKAFEHCQENGQECVEQAATFDETGEYDVEHNLKVWESESELVRASTPDDSSPGYIDLSLTEAETSNLVDNGVLDEVPDLEPLFEPHYLESVYVAGNITWPAEDE